MQSRRRRWLAVGSVVCAVMSAHGAILPIGEWEDEGLAVVTASPWDMGSKDNLFDGNWSTFYRTDATHNPAIVTVEFTERRSVGAARGQFTNTTAHDWTLEAADSPADLDAQTGSYIRIFGPNRVIGEGVQWEEWNESPVSRRIFRFIVYRVYGDNHVHIRELELQSPEPVEWVEIGGETVAINTIEIEPRDAAVPLGGVVHFSAEASLSYGPDRYDVTDLCAWSTDDPAIAAAAAGGAVTGTALGATTLRASLGAVTGRTGVSVREARPIDLDVPFIHRTPEYNRFRVSFSGDQHIQPGYEDEQKWPEPGELVTFTAHVFNKGDVAATNIRYRWYFDGRAVGKGTIESLPGGSRAEVSYSRTWPADTVQTVDVPPGAMVLHPKQKERAIGDHTIRIVVDPDDEIPETCELNNVAEDYINALTFWMFIDETTYSYMNAHPNFIDSYSAEDWCRMQLIGFERRLRVSGCRQKLRLDMVAVYPDGQLSAGGTHEPVGSETRQADGRWGFQIAEWPESKVMRYARIIENPLLHEWGHQIGLIDIYQYDIATGNCLITRDGARVADTPLLPRVSPWNVYYGNIRVLHDGSNPIVPDNTGRALMADPSRRYLSIGSATGMNRNLGLRRGFFGDYLGAIQQGEIRIRMRRHDGDPVAGCGLRIFQRETDGSVPDQPKFSGTTDGSGTWVFPDHALPDWHGGIALNNPWSWEQGGVVYNAPNAGGGNVPLLVELSFDGTVEYHFVEVDELNAAMAEGQVDSYTIELTTYESRLPNALPVIGFEGTGGSVYLSEGEFFQARVYATDADGDPVTLSATPLYNTTFEPATGVFTFRPDSLQVNRYEGHTEPMYVIFRADDGKFRSTRRMTFYVSDDPEVAYLDETDHDGDGAGDLADPDDDNDGLWDEDEIRFGLDPLDPASVVRILSIEIPGEDPQAVRLIWPAAASRTYRIEWAPAPGHWDEVGGPALGDIEDRGDGTRAWTDRGRDPEMGGEPPGEAPARFYRIAAD